MIFSPCKSYHSRRCGSLQLVLNISLPRQTVRVTSFTRLPLCSVSLLYRTQNPRLHSFKRNKTSQYSRYEISPHGQSHLAPMSTRMQPVAGLVCLFSFYCASGTLLTLVNKLVMVQFPFPNAVVTLQNMTTIAVLMVGSNMSPSIFGRMPVLSRETLMMWAPLVTAFVVVLVSSMLALLRVSAVTLIVIRNLTAISVAVLERVVLGTSVSGSSVVALLGMVSGAVAFGLHDLTFDAQGYAWLVVNMAGTSCYQVMVKRIISKDASAKIGPFGFAYLNNVMSVPLLALIAVANKEPVRIGEVMPVDKRAAITLLFSCGLGCILSVSGFVLNTMISATSLMVVNNVNKFLVIILSELFIQRTLDDVATAGVVTVMLFGCLYAHSTQFPERRAKKLKASTTWSDSSSDSAAVALLDHDEPVDKFRDKGTV